MRRVLLAPFLAAVVLLGSCGFLGRGAAPPAPSGRVNVNTAELEDIAQLPGVTPSMARRIYEGRPYATVDELVERGLLSERELERVRKRITTGTPAPRKDQPAQKPVP